MTKINKILEFKLRRYRLVNGNKKKLKESFLMFPEIEMDYCSMNIIYDSNYIIFDELRSITFSIIISTK